MNTIPIQELVDETKSLEKKGLKAFLLAEIAALVGPLSGLGGWLANTFIDHALDWAINKAVEYQWTLKFRVNMDVITSDQGADYRKTIAELNRAKKNPNLSTEEWERLERAANSKLIQLGNYTK